jgi:hypothetical protein
MPPPNDTHVTGFRTASSCFIILSREHTYQAGLPTEKLPPPFMADPLSISASVAGLLSLVIQVADGTYQYVSSARSASTTISSLLRELRALKTVLVRLDDLTHSSYTEASGDAPIISPLDIEVCREDLQEIYRKLNNKLDGKGSTKALHRFAWPFLEDKTLQMVAKLHRYVEIFHLALSADSW